MLRSRITRWLGAVAVLMLLAGCAGARAGPVTSGEPAVALAVTNLDGAASEVQPEPGQPLWLSFWASWCHPCRAEWPELDQAQRNMAGQGLRLVAVSVNEPTETVQRFVAEHPASFMVVLDPAGQAAARYGVVGLPTHILIDRDGVVRAVVRGPLGEARVRALLDLN